MTYFPSIYLQDAAAIGSVFCLTWFLIAWFPLDAESEKLHFPLQACRKQSKSFGHPPVIVFHYVISKARTVNKYFRNQASDSQKISDSTRDTVYFEKERRESVVYWYSFSNPRTKCVKGHCSKIKPTSPEQNSGVCAWSVFVCVCVWERERSIKTSGTTLILYRIFTLWRKWPFVLQNVGENTILAKTPIVFFSSS